MKIAIIAKFNKNIRPHVATNEVFEHISKKLSIDIEVTWIDNENTGEIEAIIPKFNGVLIAPGSTLNATMINIIKYTRTHKIPTLGTCGGFQNIVIEFARNVLNIKDAAHAEYDDKSNKLVVTPLTCSLAGQTHKIRITDIHSKAYFSYQKKEIIEKYYCNFGINNEYINSFEKNGFNVTGKDEEDVRIMELDNHPFYIITLFVPQDNSSFQNPHPLIENFIKSCLLLNKP